MHITKLVRQKFEVATVEVDVPVRYEDEDIPFDAPMRTGNQWTVTIDANTGIIANWPQGKTLDVHMKVVDEGNYYVKGPQGEIIVSCEEDYVPRWVPGEYGDYVVMTIDERGHIKEWDAVRFLGRLQDCINDMDDN